MYLTVDGDELTAENVAEIEERSRTELRFSERSMVEAHPQR